MVFSFSSAPVLAMLFCCFAGRLVDLLIFVEWNMDFLIKRGTKKHYYTPFHRLFYFIHCLIYGEVKIRLGKGGRVGYSLLRNRGEGVRCIEGEGRGR